MNPGPPLTSHEVLITLLGLGISYREARQLPLEDALCLLHHARHRERIRQCEEEGQRLAGLPLADPEEQHRALLGVKHRVQAEFDRFHRPREMTHQTAAAPNRRRDEQ